MQKAAGAKSISQKQYAKANKLLGDCYLNGIGVAEYSSRAEWHYGEACDNGSVEALAALGEYYLKSEIYCEKGRALLQRALQKGYADAGYILWKQSGTKNGNAITSDVPLSKDAAGEVRSNGEFYLKQAAELGSQKAAIQLYSIEKEKGELKSAIGLLNKFAPEYDSVANGDLAQQLGAIYMEQYPPQYDKAVGYLTVGAEKHNHGKSKLLLAQLTCLMSGELLGKVIRLASSASEKLQDGSSQNFLSKFYDTQRSLFTRKVRFSISDVEKLRNSAVDRHNFIAELDAYYNKLPFNEKNKDTFSTHTSSVLGEDARKGNPIAWYIYGLRLIDNGVDEEKLEKEFLPLLPLDFANVFYIWNINYFADLSRNAKTDEERRGNAETALRCYDMLQQSFPSFVPPGGVFADMGFCYFILGNKAKAFQQYTLAALNLNANGLYGVASLLQEYDAYEHSEMIVRLLSMVRSFDYRTDSEYYHIAPETFPNTYKILTYQRGERSYFEANHFYENSSGPEGIQNLLKAKQECRQAMDLGCEKAISLMQKIEAQINESTSELEKEIQKKPSAKSLASIGKLLLSRDKDAALESFRRVAELDSRHTSDYITALAKYEKDSEQRSILNQMAEEGNPDALYALSVASKGAERDELIKKAALAGSMNAQKWLGIDLLSNRTKVSVDEKVAQAHWILRAAQQGDVESQLAVAKFYSSRNLPKYDEREATKWYGIAAENGSSEAMGIFPLRLYLGIGVDADAEQARILLKKYSHTNLDAQAAAALLQITDGKTETGERSLRDALDLYSWSAEIFQKNLDNGLDDVTINFENVISEQVPELLLVDSEKNYLNRRDFLRNARPDFALMYYKDFIELPDYENRPIVCLGFGDRHIDGNDVEKNPETAASYYRQSAHLGLDLGWYELAKLHQEGMIKSVDDESYFNCLIKAAKTVDKARIELAEYYLNDEKNMQLGVDMLKRLGAAGNSDACFALGRWYSDVMEDADEAIVWYDRAHGYYLEHPRIFENLALLYKKKKQYVQMVNMLVRGAAILPEIHDSEFLKTRIKCSEMLGEYYLKGDGPSGVSLFKSLEWYKKAADDNSRVGMAAAGLLSLIRHNVSKAMLTQGEDYLNKFLKSDADTTIVDLGIPLVLLDKIPESMRGLLEKAAKAGSKDAEAACCR